MGVLLIKNLEPHYVNAGVSAQVFREWKILLVKKIIRRKKESFFETAEKVFRNHRSQMSGNPV
jgi:hypothetical protein